MLTNPSRTARRLLVLGVAAEPLGVCHGTAARWGRRAVRGRRRQRSERSTYGMIPPWR
jgi:hypothetical protein